MNNLVLSLFPGIGLLDMAFEGEGFCVVRGPDLLWGGDIKRFHPPEGFFQGVIGGPPCQPFSRLRYLVEYNGKKIKGENLIFEFSRCIQEAAPEWFLMENVREAPNPEIKGYNSADFLLNNRACGGEQERIRKIVFGRKGKPANLRRFVSLIPLMSIDKAPTVCASGLVGITKEGKRVMGIKTANALEESLRLQGLPKNFLNDAPFTIKGKHQVIGNGVPLPMGRVLAKAVKALLAANS